MMEAMEKTIVIWFWLDSLLVRTVIKLQNCVYSCAVSVVVPTETGMHFGVMTEARQPWFQLFSFITLTNELIKDWAKIKSQLFSLLPSSLGEKHARKKTYFFDCKVLQNIQVLILMFVNCSSNNQLAETSQESHYSVALHFGQEPVNVIGRQCLWDTRDGFLCLVYSVMKTIDNTWSWFCKMMLSLSS